MKRGDIFAFTAPNGVEVTAIVVDSIITKGGKYGQLKNVTHICYAQNRLFYYFENQINYKDTEFKYGKIICEYCILPDCDDMLDRYNDIEVAQAETASGM